MMAEWGARMTTPRSSNEELTLGVNRNQVGNLDFSPFSSPAEQHQRKPVKTEGLIHPNSHNVVPK